jgi:branched-chain amino acid transport system permease protein
LLSQLAVNGLIAGVIYALIALGFAIIYKTVRFFHLAHGVVYAAGAYLAYSLFIQLGWNPMLSFFLPRRWQPLLALELTGSYIVL